MNVATVTPRMLIGVAVVGLVVVSFLAWHWLREPVLKDADLTLFTGTVAEVREVGIKDVYLEIKLAGQPYPFRCFSSLYPHAFAAGGLAKLGPGVPVSVGVPNSAVGSPARNWIQNQVFYSFLTMKVAGEDALTIAAHNKAVESDRKVGTWFCLVVAIVAIWLFRVGWKYRHSNEPVTKIFAPKARKRRSSPRFS